MLKSEILTITALSALGLCLLLSLAKEAVKKPAQREAINHGCSFLFFAAVVLIAVSQLPEVDGFFIGR